MSVANPEPVPTARLVTLKVIRSELCRPFFRPLPSLRTIRRWMTDARVPSFKAGVRSAKGGGPVYYRTADVERWLRQRAGL